MIDPDDEDPNVLLAAELPIVKTLLRRCGIQPSDLHMAYDDGLLGFTVNVSTTNLKLQEYHFPQVYEASNLRGHVLTFEDHTVETAYWAYANDRAAVVEALSTRLWN